MNIFAGVHFFYMFNLMKGIGMIKTICICKDKTGHISVHVDTGSETYTREELQQIHSSWGELINVVYADSVHIAMLL